MTNLLFTLTSLLQVVPSLSFLLRYVCIKYDRCLTDDGLCTSITLRHQTKPHINLISPVDINTNNLICPSSLPSRIPSGRCSYTLGSSFNKDETWCDSTVKLRACVGLKYVDFQTALFLWGSLYHFAYFVYF